MLVLWDVLKAYIWGILISIKAYREKQRHQVGKQLEQRIKQLEEDQKKKQQFQELINCKNCEVA